MNPPETVPVDPVAIARASYERAAAPTEPTVAWSSGPDLSQPIGFLNSEDFGKATPVALTLSAVLRVGAQRTRWSVTVNRGADEYVVELGTTTEFGSRAKFRRAVFESTGCWLPPGVAGTDWDRLTSALHAASELRDHDSSARSEALAWVAHYLESGPGLDRDTIDLLDRESLARMLGAPSPDKPGGRDGFRRPCFDDTDGRLHVRIESLVQHVTTFLARTTRVDLAAHLAALDFTNVQHSARSGDRVFKGRFWQSPPGFDPEETR